MSLHRFFVTPSAFKDEKMVALDGELAHQLGRVLRLAPGALVLLLDGIGREYVVELTQFHKSGMVEGRIVEERTAENEPHTKITLYQALLKGEKFDYVLQKATEVGVSAFVPMLTERVIGGSGTSKVERWRKIVREAAEQSRRGVLPSVAEPMLFSEALKLAAKEKLALMAWEDEKTLSLRKALQDNENRAHSALLQQDARGNENQARSSLLQNEASVGLMIGPEGGFSIAEAEQARAAGIKTISLGPRILRAETAGPIAAALILYELEDM